MKKNTFLYVIIPSLLLLSSCSWFARQESVQTKDSLVISIQNEQDFKAKVLESKKPTIVKFTATWCGACKVVQGLYEEIAQTYKDQYAFAIVDVDQTRTLAKEYKIQGIPAFLFFNNGKEVDNALRIVGIFEKPDFIQKINQAFKPAQKQDKQ